VSNESTFKSCFSLQSSKFLYLCHALKTVTYDVCNLYFLFIRISNYFQIKDYPRGTMLQAERPWDLFLMRLLTFFNLPNRSSRTIVLGLTQPLSEKSTTNLLEGLKIDLCIRLITSPPSVRLLSRRCEVLGISKLYGSPRIVTGIALHFTLFF
jgi:hypothetical protein